MNMTERQKELDLLSTLSNEAVLISVAGCEETHPSTLDRLASNKVFAIKAKVARNLNTSPETLDKMADTEDENLLRTLTSNSSLYTKTLDKILANYRKLSDDTLIACLSHLNMSPKTLYKFRNSKYYLTVLKNPKANAKLLEWAYEYIGGIEIHEIIVEHPNASFDLLRRISQLSSSYRFVKYAKARYIRMFCKQKGFEFQTTDLPLEASNINFWNLKDIDTYLNYLAAKKAAC